MKVVVTGAGGFIGGHLVRDLAGAGYQVAGIAREGTPPAETTVLSRGDVREAATWSVVAGAKAVVHLAGFADASLSHRQPVEYNMANAVGTLLGLEAARRDGATFVLASSQRVYRPSELPMSEDHPREPVDPYGFSKLVAEQWVAMYRRVYGLPGIVLRFFSVYGPGQRPGHGASGVVALFVARARRGEELVVHNRSYRDFTYVADVVAGIRRALESPRAAGETYNIATGVATSTEELARAVVSATGARVPIRVQNADLPGESYVADIAKARAGLGYAPAVGLCQGLERYADWLRDNG